MEALRKHDRVVQKINNLINAINGTEFMERMSTPLRCNHPVPIVPEYGE